MRTEIWKDVLTVVFLSLAAGSLSGGCGWQPHERDAAQPETTAPVIMDLVIEPSSYITPCDRASMTVVASDPEGQTLRYSWHVVSAPPGTAPRLVPDADHAEFSSDAPGDYELQVMVTDTLGASAALSFSIHVQPSDTGVCAP